MNHPIVGLVLSGGRSTRMQTDKGLMIYQGKLWADGAAGKLSSLGIPVYISINKDQFLIYKDHFDTSQLMVDDNEIPGPLGGVITAHTRYPEADIFLLACDLIAISQGLLQQLFECYSNQSGGISQNYAFKLKGLVEPVAAIYSSTRLRRITELERSGKLINFSLKEVLNCKSTTYISLQDENAFQLKNYNSPDDLLCLDGKTNEKK